MIMIAVLGTFDTKGAEHAFVADRIRQMGHCVLLIDVGTGESPTIVPDITRDEVMRATTINRGIAADSAGQPRAPSTDRGEAIATMATAVSCFLRQLVDQRKIQGIISLGGSGGTALATTAMRALPLGFPKVMVSTMAGVNVASYVDVSDIVMIPSIVDISGLNRISRDVFSRAAAVVVALANARPAIDHKSERSEKPLVVASMFGNTTKCVEHAKLIIEAAGYEVLTFHATGIGGRTMEALIDSGEVAGVLDITTTEWADQWVGGVMPGGPHRLEAAARRGVPAIVAPGCLDMVNFGERSNIPEKFRDRLFYEHNPQVTLMRTTADECTEIGRIIAEKLNQSKGEIRFLYPLKAISVISANGQAFFDADADSALLESIRKNLRADIPFEAVDCKINDPVFAKRCAEQLLDAMRCASATLA